MYLIIFGMEPCYKIAYSLLNSNTEDSYYSNIEKCAPYTIKKYLFVIQYLLFCLNLSKAIHLI